MAGQRMTSQPADIRLCQAQPTRANVMLRLELLLAAYGLTICLAVGPAGVDVVAGRLRVSGDWRGVEL